MPAATLVLLFSVMLTTTWLPVNARQDALRQIAAAAAYVLNWLLASNSRDYFGPSAGASPVTHYWSPSVESRIVV